MHLGSVDAVVGSGGRGSCDGVGSWWVLEGILAWSCLQGLFLGSRGGRQDVARHTDRSRHTASAPTVGSYSSCIRIGFIAVSLVETLTRGITDI